MGVKALSAYIFFGNCEEELPKKPVGRLSADCRPTVYRQSTDRLRKKKNCVNVSRTSYRQATDRLLTHYQQSADRFFGELFFTITARPPITGLVKLCLVDLMFITTSD